MTLISAPLLGWGRYETFEFGCTIAFHDPSRNMRSYVLVCMVVMFGIPLLSCVCCYCRIIWYSYQCKLELFGNIEEVDEDDCIADPIVGFSVDPEREQRMDSLISAVDPKLIEALSIVERKLTRMTLAAAFGFMLAWIPFCILCFWEMATPPTEIPSSKAFKFSTVW